MYSPGEYWVVWDPPSFSRNNPPIDVGRIISPMTTFNYSDELKKLTQDRQLAEVFLKGAPTYKVAYLLAVTDEYLTFAEVNSSAQFAGIIICHLNDVESISVKTEYLTVLAGHIQVESVFEKITQSLGQLTDFTFTGFFSAFENQGRIMAITLDNEDEVAGRVMGYNDQVLMLDEYVAGRDHCVARSYYNLNSIIRLSVDVPWLRTISRYLQENNL